MYHVYSTMANPTRYVKYRQATAGQTSTLPNGRY